MSPGDIDQLALSDDVAFRVHFASATPPSAELYWRGPVMHDFDGRTWRRSHFDSPSAPPLQPQGPAYRYTVSLEPHQHSWIFALDWPSQWNLRGHRADRRLHAGAARPGVAPDRCDRHLLHAGAVAHILERVAAPARYATAAESQPAHGAARANPAQRTSGRHRIHARRPRHVHTAALLLHLDAAQARRQLGGRISVRHQARLLRPLCLRVRRADARRGDTGACGDRLSGRDFQPLRGLLDRAAKRRARLGRGVDRGARLAAHRSHLGDRREPRGARCGRSTERR